MSLKLPSKYTLKASYSGLKIITLISVLAIIFTNYMIAYNLNAITKVMTNSQNTSSVFTNEVPVGYIKGNYKTKAFPYHGELVIIPPSADELSLQEAAEIAAQTLFKFYNVQLTDQTLRVCYSHPGWFVHIDVTPDYTFTVSLDSYTGEISSITCQGSPTLTKLPAAKVDENLDYGITLAKKGLSNTGEAYAKLQALLTTRRLITEPIKSIKYVHSTYTTFCNVAHPYSEVIHIFNITTASTTSYQVATNYDLTNILEFSSIYK